MASQASSGSTMRRTISLKPPIPQLRNPPLNSLAFVTFRHPGYESPSDILFRLPRLDSACVTTSSESSGSTTLDAGTKHSADTISHESNSRVVGVHHRTALQACQIIANNAFDGYLATDRDGLKQVTIEEDEILAADTYWFIANRCGTLNQVDGRDVYPVVPSFEDWAFPHERFPALGWQTRRSHESGPSDINAIEHTSFSSSQERLATSLPLAPPPPPRQIGYRCVLSNTSYSLHKAHIIPSAHEKWFGQNSMAIYGHSSRLMDDDSNILYMKHDLHSVWDAHNFALVPKGEDDFAVHMLSIPNNSMMEFVAFWHNIPVQKESLSDTAEAYIFAKFAQAVFMLLKPFLVQLAEHRYVAKLQARVNDPRHRYEVKEMWLSGRSLCDMYGGGGSRSASSSRKRSRSQASVDPGNRESDLEREGRWYEMNVRPDASDSEDDREAVWYRRNVTMADSNSVDDDQRSAHGEPRRGRPRKRQRRAQRERREYTVDTVPSLTDTSAVGVDGADRSFEEISASLSTSNDTPGTQQNKCSTGEASTEVAQDQEDSIHVV